MIARFRLGRGTNVSETDRVMSNRHMADTIQLNSYGFHHIVLQNAALATVHSEDTWFFWVILCSLAFLIDSCMSSPKNFLCGKLDDSRLCLLCGKIALYYFVEKSLGGYCSTFICNGLHTYALSIFGSFVKMSVLFNFVCVCVCILCFFLT